MTSYKYQGATQEAWGQQASTSLVVLSRFTWPVLWKWMRSFSVNTRFWMHTSFAFHGRKQLSIPVELWKNTNLQSSHNLQKQSWRRGGACQNQEEVYGNEKANLRQRGLTFSTCGSHHACRELRHKELSFLPTFVLQQSVSWIVVSAC